MTVPDLCTLPTAQQPARLAEFDHLFATAVEQANRISPLHLRLILSGGPALEATVRDLAARETECCSFFAFTITGSPGVVTFDIEVPSAHVDVLDALAIRAAQLAGTR